MSADPQTLASQSACYICAGTSLTEGMILALLAQIVGGGIGPDTGNARITEDGQPRITEDGNIRITQ
jgi:hypothetical protein